MHTSTFRPASTLLAASALFGVLTAGCGGSGAGAAGAQAAPPPSSPSTSGAGTGNSGPAAGTAEPAFDDCVVGTWVNDEFTLPGITPDLPDVGGSGAVMTVHEGGAIDWAFAPMHALGHQDPVFDHRTSIQSDGTATGSIVTADGSRWEVETDLTAMSGQMNAGDMTVELEDGPGLYVMMLEGTYTCSGSQLTYQTQDPVHGSTVTVTLQRS